MVDRIGQHLIQEMSCVFQRISIVFPYSSHCLASRADLRLNLWVEVCRPVSGVLKSDCWGQVELVNRGSPTKSSNSFEARSVPLHSVYTLPPAHGGRVHNLSKGLLK